MAQRYTTVKKYKNDLIPGLCVKKHYVKDKSCKLYEGVVVCTYIDVNDQPVGVVLYEDGDVVESAKSVLEYIGAFYNYLFL